MIAHDGDLVQVKPLKHIRKALHNQIGYVKKWTPGDQYIVLLVTGLVNKEVLLYGDEIKVPDTDSTLPA